MTKPPEGIARPWEGGTLRTRPARKVAAVQGHWLRREIRAPCEEYGLTPEELAENVRKYEPRSPVPVLPGP